MPRLKIRTFVVPFNIYGNSPMVDHYLNRYGLQRVQRQVKINRHEVYRGQDLKPEINYTQVVKESEHQAMERIKAYKKVQAKAHRERNLITADLNRKLSLEDKKQNQTLQKPSSIKSFADQIVEQHAQLQDSARKTMA